MVSPLSQALALEAIRRDWPRPNAAGQIVEVGLAPLLWFLIEGVVTGLGFVATTSAVEALARPGDEELAQTLASDWLGSFLYGLELENRRIDAETIPPILTAARASRFRFALAAAENLEKQPTTTALEADAALRQLDLALITFRREERAAQGLPAVADGSPSPSPVLVASPSVAAGFPWPLALAGAAALGLAVYLSRRS